MPKLVKDGFDDRFHAMNNMTVIYREKNDCTVKALAITTGVDYHVANDVLRKCGRKNRHGCYDPVWKKSYSLTGHALKQLSIFEFLNKIPESYRKNIKNLTTYHPKKFPGIFDPNKKYIIQVRGHVLPVIGGKVVDWSSDRAKRAIAVYEVEKVC